MQLGKTQKLKIIKSVDFGMYLADTDAKSDPEKDKVLLPKKYVPAGAKIGDEVEVFLYKDSEDRLIAATLKPGVEVGGLAKLRVKEVAGIGAFLDWGMEKDLLLPFAEQTRKVKAGQEVLVTAYIDKSDRLCATMNVYEALENRSPYIANMKVKGVVYQISERFGAFVAVDERYSALIPKKEMYGRTEMLRVGDVVEARIGRVLEDGRLELSIRDKAYNQRNDDAVFILNMMDERDGHLGFNDKASPEDILRETGMSKAQFKRAVGKLLKDGDIEITKDDIHRI